MQTRDAVDTDADGLVRLLNESGFPPGHTSHEQVAELLKSWQLRVAVEEEGRIAGCAGILRRAGEQPHLVAGIVQQSDLDICSELFDWIRQRSAELREDGLRPAYIEMAVSAEDQRQCQLLALAGFRLHTRLWLMERPITAVTPPASLAEVRLEPYDKQRFEGFAECYKAVYVDQRVVDPPLDRSALRAMVESGAFRPDLSALAIAGDEVVGFMLVSADAAPGRIEISPVGTLRSWRGRGIASGLLVHVLNQCASARIELATLMVDADSPTGAARLYQRHGFQTTSAMHIYRGPIE